MRKTYFQLNILRRNCSKKYGKNQVRQDVKRALKAKKEARAIKQAQREEKKRNKRGKIYKKIINFYILNLNWYDFIFQKQMMTRIMMKNLKMNP